MSDGENPDVSGHLYVYGIVGSGLDDLPELAPVGGMAAPRLLTVGDVAALVSTLDVPDLLPTRRNLLAHTRVQEALLPLAPLLPVSFGTILPDEDAIMALLEAQSARLTGELARIQGHVELNVRAAWKDGAIFREVIAEEPEIRKARDRLRDQPGGDGYGDRIELGRMIEAALAARRERDAARLLSRLEAVASEVVSLTPQGEQGVLNAAFLVPSVAETAFDAAVNALDEAHGARLDFTYVGPVPPYNFVRLSLGEGAP